MRINAIALPPGTDLFYSSKWIRIVEDHLSFLRNHEDTYTTPMDEYLRFRKDKNFYGMLAEMGIALKYYIPYLRVNGMSTPEEFDDSFTQLVVPSKDAIDKLMRLYNTKQG